MESNKAQKIIKDIDGSELGFLDGAKFWAKLPDNYLMGGHVHVGHVIESRLVLDQQREFSPEGIGSVVGDILTFNKEKG